MNTLKKLILPIAVVAAFIGYVVYGKFQDNDDIAMIPPKDTTTASTTVVDVIPPPATTTSPITGMYKDGSYTGKSVDAFYGPLQVKAVIKNGALADVIALAYPNDRPTSVQISQSSFITLRVEALKAQSANVDTVSGATQTSQGFRESLASALVQAKN